MNNNIFSGIRLRQILNDLKRRPEDASKELKISKKKINNILKGKQKLDLRIIKKMIESILARFSFHSVLSSAKLCQ